MKSLQISAVFAFLFALFAALANGFHFYGPYDVYKTRVARWPSQREVVSGVGSAESDDNNFPNRPDSEQDYYKIISYLNNVGKRRR